MRNRIVFLFMMSTTWACVFISEPDVGASGEFDFFPEDPSGQQSGATLEGSDAGIVVSSTPDPTCQRDDVARCEAADSGVDESASEIREDTHLPEPGLQAVPNRGAANDIPIIPLDEDGTEDETDREDEDDSFRTGSDEESDEDDESSAEDDDPPAAVSESGEAPIENDIVSDDPSSDDY